MNMYIYYIYYFIILFFKKKKLNFCSPPNTYTEYYYSTDYLLCICAKHYLNVIMFVDCEPVRSLMMTDLVKEKLNAVGIQTVSIPHARPQEHPTNTTLSPPPPPSSLPGQNNTMNQINPLRHSWNEFPNMDKMHVSNSDKDLKSPSISSSNHIVPSPSLVVKEPTSFVFDGCELVKAMKNLF